MATLDDRSATCVTPKLWKRCLAPSQSIELKLKSVDRNWGLSEREEGRVS